MDFDAVADELYGTDRAGFVSLRGRRAAEARAAGERDLQRRISRLRKPTTAAALVNRLVRDRPTEVDGLLDLGGRLRRAHADLAGDRIRTLTRQRADAVRELTRRARDLADAEVGESVVREVETTLEAAAGDPEAGREVRVGRLTSALRPGDPFAGSWLPRAATPAPAREPTPRRGKRRRAGPADHERPGPATPPEPESPPPPEPPPESQREERPRSPDRDRKAQRRRRDREVAARRTRDEARQELRAAEREEARARERTEAARRALEAAEADLEDLP